MPVVKLTTDNRQLTYMISIPSFAKINLGLKIGPARPDGFHELRTVYQTLALHDVIRVEVRSGEGIEIRCSDPRVPLDASNTCYKVAERVMGRFAGDDRCRREANSRSLDSLRSLRMTISLEMTLLGCQG